MRAEAVGNSQITIRRKRPRVVTAAITTGLLGALAFGGGLAATAPASAASLLRVTSDRPLSAAPAALPASDWPAYLDGPLHASFSPAQTAITSANAATLVQKWHFTTGSPYLASPTVAASSVFIGSARGWFYKLSETTGKVLDKVYIGRQPKLTCPATGVTSTATVAASPAGHVITVYVAGGDGYLYALKASDLKVEWRSAVGIPSAKINNFYNWASPTVADGKVYMGVSSNCDTPLIRGGVIAYNQATGKKLAQFYAVPAGAKNAGASVWSSIGVAPDGDVYATTGNGPVAKPRLDHSESILKLSPSALKLLGSFKVPARQVTSDGDFGGSPVFFGGDVGACNKNGIFYALDRATMKLAWSARIATAAGGTGECLAAPAYNGTDLFVAGMKTKIGATSYRGSVQERVASTGALVWSTGMPGGVIGSPTLDGGGVLTAGAYSSPPAGIYLLNASTGAIVRKLAGGMTFGQSVFASKWLFCANSKGVTAWALPAG